jgi:hypothetical protein
MRAAEPGRRALGPGTPAPHQASLVVRQTDSVNRKIA